jgi:hypothetical protein
MVWIIGFIDTLYTPLGTTCNYSAVTDLHTLQFTAANTSVISLLQSPLAVSLQRILTQTTSITVSLSYTLQISRYYSTRKVFSSQPDFQLHWTALNNSDSSIPLLRNSYPGRLASRNSTDSFSIIFDCRLKRLPQLYLCCVRSSLYSLGAAPTENTVHTADSKQNVRGLLNREDGYLLLSHILEVILWSSRGLITRFWRIYTFEPLFPLLLTYFRCWDLP